MDLLANFQKILDSFIIPFQWNCDLKEYFLKSCGRTQTMLFANNKYLHVDMLGRVLKTSRKPEDCLIIMPYQYYYSMYTQIVQFYPWIHELLNMCLLCYCAQIMFMKPDTCKLCGPIIIGYHLTADFIPWELFSFDRWAVHDESYGFLFHSFAKQSVQNVTPTTKFISGKKLAASAFSDKILFLSVKTGICWSSEISLL